MNIKPIGLVPENSYFKPIEFNIKGVDFMIGVWTNVIDSGPYFTCLYDRGQGFRNSYFTMTYFRPSAIKRYGGLHTYLLRHFEQWVKTFRLRFGMGSSPSDVDVLQIWFDATGREIESRTLVGPDTIEFDLSVPTDAEVKLFETPWTEELK